MYRQTLMTAEEAFIESRVTHKAWNPGTWNINSFIEALDDARDSRKESLELVLFIDMVGISKTLLEDDKFSDYFDPSTQVEVRNKGFLGKVFGVDIYTMSGLTYPILKERLNDKDEALAQIHGLINIIKDPNFKMAENKSTPN